MFNLTKIYPELLELNGSPDENKKSLYRVFKRDIEDTNPPLSFRKNIIYPIKKEGKIDLANLFTHLTCKEEMDKVEAYTRRVFDIERSKRLHWIKHHIEEKTPSHIEIFTLTERHKTRKKNTVKTYIYNKTNKYVVILEHQRRGGYYLLTAFYLSEKYAEKSITKKIEKSRKQATQ